MVFLRDQPAKLLIRISKQGNRVIPVSRLGKGIYNSTKSTVETITKFITVGLVIIEKKGKLSLAKLTPKGFKLCRTLFEIREEFGEGIVCYERKQVI